MKTELLDKIVDSAADRRTFMKRAGTTGHGLAAMTMLGGSLAKAQAQDASSDASYNDGDILNIALTLEYLEAEFYLMATYGTTLVKSGVITASEEAGPTTGGKMVNFTKADVSFVASGLRTNEVDHVKCLRSPSAPRRRRSPRSISVPWVTDLQAWTISLNRLARSKMWE